jgi:hypothetical protein
MRKSYLVPSLGRSVAVSVAWQRLVIGTGVPGRYNPVLIPVTNVAHWFVLANVRFAQPNSPVVLCHLYTLCGANNVKRDTHTG